MSADGWERPGSVPRSTCRPPRVTWSERSAGGAASSPQSADILRISSGQSAWRPLHGDTESWTLPMPLRLSEYNSRTCRLIVTKLVMRNLWTIWHLPWNFQDRTLYDLRPVTWFSRSCHAKFAFRTASTPETCEFSIFAGDMDMDRCRKVTFMAYTDIVTFPRSTEVIRGQWPLMTSHVIFLASLESLEFAWIWHPFLIHIMWRNRVIGVTVYLPQRKIAICRKEPKLFFDFWLPKWSVWDRIASHCILKPIMNVLVFKSRL